MYDYLYPEPKESLMSTKTLEQLITEAGSPVKMLRESRAGAFQFPIPAEYSN